MRSPRPKPTLPDHPAPYPPIPTIPPPPKAKPTRGPRTTMGWLRALGGAGGEEGERRTKTRRKMRGGKRKKKREESREKNKKESRGDKKPSSGGLRSIFGRFVGVLEGLLGRSGGRLGPSWVVNVASGSTRRADPQHLDQLWESKGSQDETKMGAKKPQNRCQKR